MNQKLLRILPWIITVVALYLALHGIEWEIVSQHLADPNLTWLGIAVALTILSYLLRSHRWQYFFITSNLTFFNAAKVLLLGFFANNVVPARGGELVRAHFGAKVTKEKRTLVLATIASERLVDGAVLSLMFVLFALGVGDERMSYNILYVAFLFGGVTVAVILTLIFRRWVFAMLDKISGKMNHRLISFAFSRLQIFIEGLSPLTSSARLPLIVLWSVMIWSVELGVFIAVARCYGAPLSLQGCVLFLVAVNFSSLIPSAPGAFGVIEAVAPKVLMSIGIPRELGLTMTLTQHLIQYLVVGIPGLIVLLGMKGGIQNFKSLKDD